MSGEIRLVAAREIRERTRGRIFRVGTVLILAAVAAAIVIPVLRSSGTNVRRVGVVGALPADYRDAILSAGPLVHTTIDLVHEQTLVDADADLRSGRVSVVVVDARSMVVQKQIVAGDTSGTAQLVHAVSSELALVTAIEDAHLTHRQAALVFRPVPPQIRSLQPAAAASDSSIATSILAVILVFILLTQYGTWTLMGVAEEKSSRVVEVLLSSLRPFQLLAGKVLGIGVVALSQAALIVAFALLLAKGVGSDLLAGSAPLEVVSSLVWVLLGYSFYCWVYAAAGSVAERQDQIQSMAFPLVLPMLVGYIASLTAASSGSASTFVKVLAYLPPTAPFAMPVLVGLGKVTWWQFAGSAALSIVATFFVARLASDIYRRSILSTGRSIRLRKAGPAGPTKRPSAVLGKFGPTRR
jgi:ABC-2 type transport system permease protein